MNVCHLPFYLLMQALWHLENIDVTHLLCPTKLDDDVRMSAHLHKMYRKGEPVYIPNDLADRIFFIEMGRVKISAMNEEGKEITKAILGRGEVFGELTLLGEERRHDFATALEDTTVCVVTLPELRDLEKLKAEIRG